MNGFGNSVRDFLEGKGFHCKDVTPAGTLSYQLMNVISADGEISRKVMLLNIDAETEEEAQTHSAEAWDAISTVREKGDGMPVIMAEDRWYSQTGMVRDRLLAHLEVFFPIYARNCEVRRIDKHTAADFLTVAHSYGDAACRYRYGLFLKRHTGHIARTLGSSSESSESRNDRIMDSVPSAGSLIAVATFSNARKWVKGEKTIRSYEWTRYASLPGVRVTGGMGRLLKAFIEDVCPDDIMSYADLEWSEGKVYEQLGFTLEGHKSPVVFEIDADTWVRSVPCSHNCRRPETSCENTQKYFFKNFGSAKYRLKLTEYE